MLTYCKVTNHTLEEAMSHPALQVLYVYDYEYTRRMIEEDNRQKYIRGGGFSGMR